MTLIDRMGVPEGVQPDTSYLELLLCPGVDTRIYADVGANDMPVVKVVCQGRFELAIRPEAYGPTGPADLAAAEQLLAASTRYRDAVWELVRRNQTGNAPGLGGEAVRFARDAAVAGREPR